MIRGISCKEKVFSILYFIFMINEVKELVSILNRYQFWTIKINSFTTFALLRDLLLRQDLLNTWCERRLKRSAMFLSIFRKGNSPSSFYWIPKVTLKWLWKLLVINNFNFLHMHQRSRDYRLRIIIGCKILESSVQHFLSAAFIKNPKSHRQKCSLADVLQNRCS